jgi:hypothetical protein
MKFKTEKQWRKLMKQRVVSLKRSIKLKEEDPNTIIRKET